MPIKSYLAHAIDGQRDALARALRALEGCAVIPATNREILVLVTDTADEPTEQALLDALAQVASLQCLTLVAGIADSDAAEALCVEDADDAT